MCVIVHASFLENSYIMHIMGDNVYGCVFELK